MVDISSGTGYLQSAVTDVTSRTGVPYRTITRAKAIKNPLDIQKNMSATGKRITSVISCTTMETVRVSEPALYYEADRLHIIYMSDGKSER